MSSFNVSYVAQLKGCNNFILVLPIITITRNPDSDLIDEDIVVTVTCLVTSNPQSNIIWEQITANGTTDRTDYAATQVLTNSSFNTVSSSVINFTNEDINGFSTFCCTARNDIGSTISCLNFTETGTWALISTTNKLYPCICAHTCI